MNFPKGNISQLKDFNKGQRLETGFSPIISELIDSTKQKINEKIKKNQESKDFEKHLIKNGAQSIKLYKKIKKSIKSQTLFDNFSKFLSGISYFKSYESSYFNFYRYLENKEIYDFDFEGLDSVFSFEANRIIQFSYNQEDYFDVLISLHKLGTTASQIGYTDLVFLKYLLENSEYKESLLPYISDLDDYIISNYEELLKIIKFHKNFYNVKDLFRKCNYIDFQYINWFIESGLLGDNFTKRDFENIKYIHNLIGGNIDHTKKVINSFPSVDFELFTEKDKYSLQSFLKKPIQNYSFAIDTYFLKVLINPDILDTSKQSLIKFKQNIFPAFDIRYLEKFFKSENLEYILHNLEIIFESGIINLDYEEMEVYDFYTVFVFSQSEIKGIIPNFDFNSLVGVFKENQYIYLDRIIKFAKEKPELLVNFLNSPYKKYIGGISEGVFKLLKDNEESDLYKVLDTSFEFSYSDESFNKDTYFNNDKFEDISVGIKKQILTDIETDDYDNIISMIKQKLLVKHPVIMEYISSENSLKKAIDILTISEDFDFNDLLIENFDWISGNFGFDKETFDNVYIIVKEVPTFDFKKIHNLDSLKSIAHLICNGVKSDFDFSILDTPNKIQISSLNLIRDCYKDGKSEQVYSIIKDINDLQFDESKTKLTLNCFLKILLNFGENFTQEVYNNAKDFLVVFDHTFSEDNIIYFFEKYNELCKHKNDESEKILSDIKVFIEKTNRSLLGVQNKASILHLYIEEKDRQGVILNIIEKLWITNLVSNDNIKTILNLCEENRLSKYGIENTINFGVFKVGLGQGFFDEKNEDFSVNKSNFMDYLEDDESLFEFEDDKGINLIPKPWTKKWFIEDSKRLNYLNSKDLETFRKVGTILGIGLISGADNSSNMKDFYSNIFSRIGFENNRSSILQLSEVFNLILRKENYHILDELVESKFNIGEIFKNFIEHHHISDKGRTIVTLMISREIRDSFQIFTNENGEKQVDNTDIEIMLKSVYDKLNKYKEIIDIYNNVPINTSIGLEYEVTSGIANGYKETIGSDYKRDITILSEYSGIAKGNDAVHEIATKPTDNPYLLILEMQLLQNLDFLDLNFKKEDYSRGSRSIHMTVGGEYGITLDDDSNFVQNILIASNLGGVNAGNEINIVNNYGNVREKGYDCEALFSEDKTPCLEYRSLSIDKAEPFERLVISTFNLTMAKQAIAKYINIEDFFLSFDFTSSLKSLDIFKKYLQEKKFLLKEEINDEKIYKLVFEFIKLKLDIEKIIDNHNKNFENDETISGDFELGLEKVLLLLTSTGPIVSIMKKVGLDLKYFKSLENIETREEFENKLIEDGKNIESLSENQKSILFLNYKKRLLPIFKDLQDKYPEIYNDIGKYLNGNTDDTIRKITNGKRFKEVIKSGDLIEEEYIQSLSIDVSNLYEIITPELINKFTNINNLFVKKDSTNALSMFDTTKEPDGETISNPELTETTIFEKLDRGLKNRNGYNIIQGASESMITQSIQKRVLEFNESIFNIL